MLRILVRSPTSSCVIARLLIGVGLLASGCTNPRPTSAGPGGLAPEAQRAAFQSPCAQNVITCTVSFPTAVASVEAGEGQEVIATADGFQVRGSDGDGAELVYLVGGESTPGQGATEIFFSWSFAAADSDPCTLEAGEEFSTDADTEQLMQAGFHYIRLTVRNNLPPLGPIESDECGTFPEFSRYDFVEIEVEVIDE